MQQDDHSVSAHALSVGAHPGTQSNAVRGHMCYDVASSMATNTVSVDTTNPQMAGRATETDPVPIRSIILGHA